METRLKMSQRWLIIGIVILAVIAGSLTIVLPRDQMIKVIVFRDFFDIALPILGFGALIKYLFSK
jgi:hypothetical protein